MTQIGSIIAGLVEPHGLRCSFCGVVRRVIAGPAVYICEPCIGLCADIIDHGAAEHRSALVRAALAQQWAVAVALIEAEGRDSPDGSWTLRGDSQAVFVVGRVPCAVDVVAEMMGEVRS